MLRLATFLRSLHHIISPIIPKSNYSEDLVLYIDCFKNLTNRKCIFEPYMTNKLEMENI